MTKKILLFASMLFLVFSLTACTPTQQQEDPDSLIDVETLDESEDLNAICKALYEKEFIPQKGKIMSADVIGAEKGYSFDASIAGSNIKIEIYRFDKDNLNEVGKKTVESIKTKGSFNMLGYKDIDAEMLGDDKYMLIYPDTNLDKEENKAKKAEVVEIINEAK